LLAQGNDGLDLIVLAVPEGIYAQLIVALGLAAVAEEFLGSPDFPFGLGMNEGIVRIAFLDALENANGPAIVLHFEIAIADARQGQRSVNLVIGKVVEDHLMGGNDLHQSSVALLGSAPDQRCVLDFLGVVKLLTHRIKPRKDHIALGDRLELRAAHRRQAQSNGNNYHATPLPVRILASRLHRLFFLFFGTSTLRPSPSLRNHRPLQHASVPQDKQKVSRFLLLSTVALLFAAAHVLAGSKTQPTTGTAPIPPHADVRLTTYILAPGDRLSGIAKRFGIERTAIERCNPWLRLNEMNVGEVIVLPLPRSIALPSSETRKDLRRGIRGLGRVALTFDAGADVGSLHDLLGVLEERGVHCSFFVTGQWVDRNGAALKRIADSGHEIFGHTFTHRLLSTLSSEEILAELEKTEQIIYQTIGQSPRPYFRPAFGEFDRRVLRIAGSAGWQAVFWTLDSRDAIGTPKTPEQIIARVLSPPSVENARQFLDGAIVLFHASKSPTALAMGGIIDGLRQMGLEPVALKVLLQPPEKE